MLTSVAPAAASNAERWQRERLVPTRRQLLFSVVLAVLGAIALNPITLNPFVEVLGETLFVAMVLLFAFTVAGAWPQRLLPRWVAQLIAVMIGAAVSPFIVQMLTVGGDFSAFVAQRPLVRGYVLVTLSAALVGTLIALGALYRERDAQARAEALRFALERETLQRQAADARLHLLTAQIEPHFLLNTLANVQQLVESGSPRAVPVFRSLIAYLRAAMPQLHQSDATLADEERLVRAYLELMLMRMPDRLTFGIDIEPAAQRLAFPPMALLTLVENAIRHGIDPACDGGRIEVGARLEGGTTLHLWVADTGVGLGDGSGGSGGAGLRNLRERLQVFYGPDARLELGEQAPGGVRAEIRVPAAARAA